MVQLEPVKKQRHFVGQYNELIYIFETQKAKLASSNALFKMPFNGSFLKTKVQLTHFYFIWKIAKGETLAALVILVAKA